MLCAKAGPALAAGCTIVIKPAEQTPLTTLYFAQLAKEVYTYFLFLTIIPVCVDV